VPQLVVIVDDLLVGEFCLWDISHVPFDAEQFFSFGFEFNIELVTVFAICFFNELRPAPRLVCFFYGVPALDGVTCAIALCEGMVRIGLKTSNAGGYAKVN